MRCWRWGWMLTRLDVISFGARLVAVVGLLAVVAIGDLVAEPQAVGWMDERAKWACVVVVCDDDGECQVTVSERCDQPTTEDR